MIKLISFLLIASLLTTSPVFAQDLTRSQIQKLTKIEPVSSVRPSYLLPPQAQSSPSTAKQSAGSSHKKRNIIIIGVAVGAAVAATVIIHKGGYGSTGTLY